MFQLPAGENIIVEAQCKYGKKNGTFYLFEKFICFSAQVFQRLTKQKIPISEVTKSPVLSGTAISLLVRNQKHAFQFEELGDAQLAFTKMSQVWKTMELEKMENSDSNTIQIDYTQNGNELLLTTATQTLVVTFQKRKDLNLQEFVGIFKRQLLNKPQAEEEAGEEVVVDKQDLLSEEWDLILDGARKEVYTSGQPILRAGEKVQRLYQILEGDCNVEIDKNGEWVNVNTMEKGEIFGELNFVLAEVASANVIAASERVEVRIIEVKTLFHIYTRKSTF